MVLIDKLKKIFFKSKKSKIITSVVVIAVVLIGVSSFVNAQNAKIKSITSTTVTKGLLTQSVTISGAIEANNRNEIALSPASKVVQVLAKEGQSVNKGDVLVKLDDSEYRSQLEKQQINLANANSQSSLSQAEITLKNAKANYEDLSKKYEQSKVMYDHGYISQNEVDAARKLAEDSSNAVASAELAISNAGSSQNGQIALINADIKYLNKKIQDCSLIANVSGVVTKNDAVEGQFPSTGDMVIVDETATYAVGLKVSQYDSVKLKLGQKAKIRVKGVTKEYDGTLTKISSLAEKSLVATDQDTKVNVKVALSNPDDNIKVGYEADVDIILEEKQDALQVSFEAVQDESSTGKKYVFVIGSNNKLEKRYVETGLDTDYNIEIKSGLKEGEKCVSNPDKALVAGDTVKETGGKK